MRITCPNCAAEYEVPERLLAAGPRSLRCARCQHEWMARPPESAAPPPPAEAAPAPQPSPSAPRPAPPEPEPDIGRSRFDAPGAAPQPGPPADAPAPRPIPARGPRAHSPIDPPLPRLAEAPTSDPGSRPVLAAWIATALVLLAAVVAAVVWREEVMAAWPPSGWVYRALGLL